MMLIRRRWYDWWWLRLLRDFTDWTDSFVTSLFLHSLVRLSHILANYRMASVGYSKISLACVHKWLRWAWFIWRAAGLSKQSVWMLMQWINRGDGVPFLISIIKKGGSLPLHSISISYQYLILTSRALLLRYVKSWELSWSGCLCLLIIEVLSSNFEFNLIWLN